jgi:hypothetical protein
VTALSGRRPGLKEIVAHQALSRDGTETFLYPWPSRKDAGFAVAQDFVSCAGSLFCGATGPETRELLRDKPAFYMNYRLLRVAVALSRMEERQ